MDTLLHSPLLFVCLGLVLLPRMVNLGKAALATTRADGTLPLFVVFLLIAVFVASLVNGA